MTDRDPHPDSPPEADNDTRSDIEQIVESRKDAVERGDGGGEEPAVENNDNARRGEVRNQDETPQ